RLTLTQRQTATWLWRRTWLTLEYRIQEFSELAGVTVRALHYYDRLGLLRPKRTRSGYRVYTHNDLERLEQIVALKFLGLSLKQIKNLLDHESLCLDEALQLQLKVLNEKRVLLDRAIAAIQEAQQAMQAGKPVEAALLKRIIEAIALQDNADSMQKYYSKAAWERRKELESQRASGQWIALFREAEALASGDPAGEKAQALAARWMELWAEDTGGDAEIQVGLMRAWADRGNWPAALRDKLSQFKIEEAADFIGKAINCHRRKYYGAEDWARLVEEPARVKDERAAAWYQLFVDVGASLEEDPAGEQAQALADRWSRLAEGAGSNDPDFRAGSIRAWMDRRQWPAPQQPLLASFNLDQVVEFIGKAFASPMRVKNPTDREEM
ncbi:MAG: MerR family transcriptional regulator, partial [Blastocatellia bacterium]